MYVNKFGMVDKFEPNCIMLLFNPRRFFFGFKLMNVLLYICFRSFRINCSCVACIQYIQHSNENLYLFLGTKQTYKYAESVFEMKIHSIDEKS